MKDKLRKGDEELPEIEQILEDKYQAMMHVKGWDEEEEMIMPSSQAKPLRKSPRKHFKDVVGTVEKFSHNAADCPNKKSNRNKGPKGKKEHKKKYSTKGDHKGKGHRDMSKSSVFHNMDILHEIVQKHMIMLILLKKVSKTRKSRICWIWTILA